MNSILSIFGLANENTVVNTDNMELFVDCESGKQYYVEKREFPKYDVNIKPSFAEEQVKKFMEKIKKKQKNDIEHCWKECEQQQQYIQIIIEE